MSKHEETKMILEWCAVFLFMFHDPVKRRSPEDKLPWTFYCLKEASKYPRGSYPYHFWWSLGYWDKNGWIGWRQNLQFRLNKNRFTDTVNMETL